MTVSTKLRFPFYYRKCILNNNLLPKETNPGKVKKNIMMPG